MKCDLRHRSLAVNLFIVSAKETTAAKSTIIQLLTGEESNIWYVRPKVKMTFCLKVQHIICCPSYLSIIVLLYLHWFRIKCNIQTIHKQNDNDQPGFNLDEMIWDELDLVWIDSSTIIPGYSEQKI